MSLIMQDSSHHNVLTIQNQDSPYNSIPYINSQFYIPIIIPLLSCHGIENIYSCAGKKNSFCKRGGGQSKWGTGLIFQPPHKHITNIKAVPHYLN